MGKESGSVQFLLGRAGSGKSHWVQQRILRLLEERPLGPPIYLLLPPQATFEHERHFTLCAGMNGYARLRVVSFETLAAEIAGECGGDALATVSRVGRLLLLGHVLRTNAHSLSYFRNAAGRAGLVREIDRTLGELERAGVEPSDLLDRLGDIADLDDQFAAKSRDLALVGDAYRKLLGDRLDPAMRLMRVIEHIDSCVSLRSATLFVDAFDGFTGFERRMLCAVAAVCRETFITLPLDPDSATARNPHLLPEPGDVFAEVAEQYRRARAGLAKCALSLQPPNNLREVFRFESRALVSIERDFTNPRPSEEIDIDASAVKLLEAPDARGAADAAARQVKDWTLAGYRLRDCLVLCRNLATHQPLLEASFIEHGLKHFVDRRRPAQHHPLVRFVRSLLRIATAGWPREAVMELCKSGLSGLDADEVDTLENYVRDHRIRGRSRWTSEEPWHEQTLPAENSDDTEIAEEDAAVADRLRRELATAIEPLSVILLGLDRPAREFFAALWGAVDRFDVRGKLQGFIDLAEANGDIEAAAEHRQAWAAVCELVDQAGDLIGNEQTSGRQFATMVDFGLDQVDFAVAPPTTDAVLLGDVERTILPPGRCRCCVVVGMNDGEFPRAAEMENVLGDEDRRLLRERDIEVESAAAGRQMRERYLGYIALTRAAERLTLVRSTADASARETSPSPYWLHVRTLLALTPTSLPRPGMGHVECVSSPRQAVTTALSWARSGAEPTHDAAAIYNFLTRATGPTRLLVDAAWPSLSYFNDAHLTDPTRDALLGDELYTSTSRLETFAACPFKHFSRFGLKLQVRPDEEVTPRDLGVVYHDVLERLIRDVLQERLDLHDTLAIEQRLPELATEVGERLRGGVLTQDARGRYLFDRVSQTLATVVAGQRAALGFGEFKSTHTELAFGGEKSTLPPLSLTSPKNRRVRLYGRIDRIDQTSSGEAMVIDYKTVARDVQLSLRDVRHSLSLQLLVYLLVLQDHGAQLGDPCPQPVAAFYVKLLRGFGQADDPADEPSPDQPLFDLRVKPRGIIDYDALPHLDHHFANPNDNADRHAGHSSEVYHVRTTKAGELYKSGTDAIEAEQFDDLLLFVRRQIRTLADQILDGNIAVKPYRISTRTPCAHCDFPGVCRIEPRPGAYRTIEPEAVDTLWEHISEEADRERREGRGE